MIPGQIVLLSSHNAGLPIKTRQGRERRLILLLWILIPGIIAGGAFEGTFADLVSTSVIGDGSVLSTSFWFSGMSILTGTIFGSGLTRIDHETSTKVGRTNNLLARSEGSLLISEYTLNEQEKTDLPITCVFGKNNSQRSVQEIRASGFLIHGNYSRHLRQNPYESLISTDGYGMMDISHRLEANDSFTGRTFATGNLSIREEIRKEP